MTHPTWRIAILFVTPDTSSWFLVAHFVNTPAFSNRGVTLHSFISTGRIAKKGKVFPISILTLKCFYQLLFFNTFSWPYARYWRGRISVMTYVLPKNSLMNQRYLAYKLHKRSGKCFSFPKYTLLWRQTYTYPSYRSWDVLLYWLSKS